MSKIENYEKTRSQSLELKEKSLKKADWMMETFDGQIGKLKVLLEKYGNLLNPA